MTDFTDEDYDKIVAENQSLSIVVADLTTTVMRYKHYLFESDGIRDRMKSLLWTGVIFSFICSMFLAFFYARHHMEVFDGELVVAMGGGCWFFSIISNYSAWRFYWRKK